MRHTVPIASQFYVTAPQPCPYLEDRMERKLFTSLQGADAGILNNSWSKQGFRRSQNVLYRPACASCSACLSARIDVAKFQPSKTPKQDLERNAALERRSTATWTTGQHHERVGSALGARQSRTGEDISAV